MTAEGAPRKQDGFDRAFEMLQRGDFPDGPVERKIDPDDGLPPGNQNHLKMDLQEVGEVDLEEERALGEDAGGSRDPESQVRWTPVMPQSRS